MTLEIPPNINDLSALAVATLHRDSGFAVVPFAKAKKRPAIKGWPALRPSHCDDEFLRKWWGNGIGCDVAVMVADPLVIIDFDGPGRPEIVVEWLKSQPALSQAPREITSRGAHVWLACPDMPAEIRANARIVIPLPGGLQAELFVSGRAVRTSPSALETGGQYHFDVTGTVPQIKWFEVQRIFGIVEDRKGVPGRPRKAPDNAWKATFAGEIATLDVARLLAESKHLAARDLLNADTSKYAVRCPWNATHSKPALSDAPPDSSTVLFHPPGQTPVFKCLHAHCNRRSLRDLLLWLEEREPGLVDACCSEQRPLWKGDGDVSPDGRPRILLPGVGREISEFAAEIGGVIGPRRTWFVREEEVARVSEIRVGTTTYLGFRRVEPTYARTALEQFVQVGLKIPDRETGEQLFEATTASPDTTAATLAAPAFMAQLPVISRVLESPIPLRLAAGGYDLPVEGYDPRFETYLRPGTQRIKPMSVNDAIHWLHQVHVGFCLADDQSRVHALARLITPYARGIMGFEHRPPVWHYHANRPRAGKDYLAAIAPLIYEGRFTEDAPLGTRAEETSKRLVSALRSGRRTMHFANCQGHLDDEYFIGAVTASVIGGRSLGRNGPDDDLQLANEIEFSLSANSGLTFRTDVEPRTRRISLFFAAEDPNNRSFPVPDLHGWVLNHRGELMSAVATLVDAWLHVGAPNGPTPFSSFKRWGDVVGGIMAYHGLGDPCLPHVDDDGSPADRETAAMRALYELMYAKHPDAWVAKAEICGIISDPAEGGEIDALDLFNGLVERSDQTKFGRLLPRYIGRELAGITLLSDGAGRTARAKYKFTRPGGGSGGGGSAGADGGGGNPLENPSKTGSEPESGPKSGNLGNVGNVRGRNSPGDKIIQKNEGGIFSELIKSVGASTSRGHQCCQGYHPPPLLRPSDLDMVAADLAGAASIALDLETYGPAKGDGLDPEKGDIRLLTVCRDGGPVHTLDLRAIGYDLGPLRDVLAKVEIIAHNAKFDAGWLAAKCGILPTRVFCTCTASRLIDAGSTLRHGLDTVLERHLRVEPGPDHSLSDWGDLILTEDQLKYAAADVEHLHRLAEVLRSKVAAAGLDKVMELEMALLPVVVCMERTGVGIDIEQLKAIRAEAEATTRAAEAEVRSLLQAPDLNLSSPKQLLAALNAGGFDLPNTAEETLKGVAEEAGVIDALLLHRSAQKVAQQPATLLKAVGRDGRLRCSFNPTGTATGRFSSSSPNLQNIGRGAIRSAFRPAPGKCLIVTDYSQIELRIAAVVAGDQKMLAAYRAGADLHRETAAAVLEKPLEEVTKDDRQLAKAVNFGLLYGQGAPGLVRYAAGSYGVEIEEEDAARIRARFFARYKGLSRWHSRGWERARAKATEVRTRLGRRRLIPPGASEWERFTALVNTEVQGGAADGMKLALVELAHRLTAGIEIISTVHDELIVEAPAELAGHVRDLTRTVMIESMARLYPEVPIEVEAHVCDHWGQK